MRETGKTITQIFWTRVAENQDKPLFIYHCEGDDPPYTYNGSLRTMSFGEVGRRVKNIGMGLLALGAGKDDTISIMSTTRPEWVIADLALLSIGGRTGTIYPNNLPEIAHYILGDLDSRFLFVEGKDRRDGILALRDKSPHLEKIITIGCDGGGDPLCMSFEELLTLGEANSARFSHAFEDAVAAGKLTDIATYIYTSGTTGIPKGAVHRHESLMYTVATCAEWFPIQPGYVDLSFLPMAHIFEQFAGAFLDIYRGDTVVAFARSMDTVAADIGIIKPSFSRSAPRFFEKVYSAIWSRAEQLTGLTPDQFKQALAVARRVRVEGELEGKSISDQDRRLLEKFDTENFSRIRTLVLGGNLKFFVGGGAPFSKEINEFFWSIGIPIYELYGMTETGPATTNYPGHVKPGTVGKSWPGENWPGGGGITEVSSVGEIIMRGPNIMVEYHKKPEETAEAIRDGWMRSGDIAEIDEDGFFRITDRIKDIIITAGGKNVAPIMIEGFLKEAPLISQAVVYGDRKKFLTALITLDESELNRVAGQMGIPAESYAKLCRHPKIKDKVKEIVVEKNKKLASFESIKDFAILDCDFTIQKDYLTPTMKLKRRKIYQDYAGILEALYPKED